MKPLLQQILKENTVWWSHLQECELKYRHAGSRPTRSALTKAGSWQWQEQQHKNHHMAEKELNVGWNNVNTNSYIRLCMCCYLPA